MTAREPKRTSLVRRILAAAPPKPQGEGPDLGQRMDAINDVAKTARALLAAMAAVAIAMTATMISASDEAIFRDAAQVFPSLAVEIRLSTAYTLAPPLFVFLHLNALLQLHLLTRRTQDFLAALDDAGCTMAMRHAWLGQIHGLAFVQMLLPDRQTTISRGLQKAATLISMVVVPVLLLLCIQISFVRYQNWSITIDHIVCLLADLALLMWFHLSLWPRDRGRIIWRAAPVTAMVALISLTQALPPIILFDTFNLFDRIVGDVPGFFWTRRTLDLHGKVLIDSTAKPDLAKALAQDPDHLKAVQGKMLTLSLPDRSFIGINLENAELFAIDLRRAKLRQARLSRAQMRGANLSYAEMQQADLQYAQMQDVDLWFAQMQGAHLSPAQMQGANLSSAEMQGADLRSAEMQGADLSSAQMQGANLWFAQMQGADLRSAQMQGADLSFAWMPGALLERTNLALAQGTLKSCAGMIASPSSVATSPDKLAEQLRRAGLTAYKIASIIEGLDPASPAHCPKGQVLTALPLPTPQDFAVQQRAVACDFADAAKALWFRSGGWIEEPFRSAARAALARPAGDDCPGLRHILPDIRQLMDAHWAELSPAQRAAGGTGR